MKILMQLELFDGEDFINFDIIDLNKDKKQLTAVVTNRGKLSYSEFDLFESKYGYYIEYGPILTKIYIDL